MKLQKLLLLVFTCLPVAAQADASFLNDLRYCSQVGPAMKNFMHSEEWKSLDEETQKEQWPGILDQVCGRRFKQCNFKFCKKYQPPAKDSEAPEIKLSPEEAKRTLGHRPGVDVPIKGEIIYPGSGEK